MYVQYLYEPVLKDRFLDLKGVQKIAAFPQNNGFSIVPTLQQIRELYIPASNLLASYGIYSLPQYNSPEYLFAQTAYGKIVHKRNRVNCPASPQVLKTLPPSAFHQQAGMLLPHLDALQVVFLFLLYFPVYTLPFKALNAQDITKKPIPTVEKPIA